jgi:hypothetical protein
MLGLTNFDDYLDFNFQTIFFANLDFSHPRPLLTPDIDRRISLTVLTLFAAGTLSIFVNVFTSSRWVDVVSNVSSLILIGLLLCQPFDNPFAVSVSDTLLRKLKIGLTFGLVFVAVMVSIDLLKNLILIGRRQLAK